MASSMAVRSLFVMVVLATASQSYAKCNTTLLEAVQATPQLSLLYTVIEASGLATTVNTTDNVTVLAPDNDAFNGTGGLLSLLASNNLTLANVTAPGEDRAASILLYHILPAPYFAANLTNGLKVPTLLGKNYNLTVFTTGNVTFVGAANNATVVTANIQVCNSVVHVVNRVLLPAATLSAIPVTNLTEAPVPSPSASPGESGAASLSAGSLFLGLTGVVAAAFMV